MSPAYVQTAQPSMRRGVCPALSAPMQTGDGLLSRVAFTDSFSLLSLRQLCELATRHGNGLMDVTARGGLQFRGLTAQSAVLLERDVLALDLPIRRGIAVETSPVSGADESEIADPRMIARDIADVAEARNLHEQLAAKMSVVIDGGGQVAMGDLLADIRLKAGLHHDTVVWHLMLGGTQARGLRAGCVTSGDAAASVIDLLTHLAFLGSEARGRDLDMNVARAILGDRLITGVPDDAGTTSPPTLGSIRLFDDFHAAVLSPAFSQIVASDVIALCDEATRLGRFTVRPGPSHAFYFLGSNNSCCALLAHAETAGFVTRIDDPRSSIAVCPGKPACASSFIETHALARHAAQDCGSLLDGSFTLHLSGCAKGCAHPGDTLLALSGRADGLGFSVSGRAGDVPEAILPLSEQKAALSRLARLYEKEHKPGENVRTLFARLGTQRVIAALRQDER